MRAELPSRHCWPTNVSTRTNMAVKAFSVRKRRHKTVRLSSGDARTATRSIEVSSELIIWPKKLNETAENHRLQRLTKPLHYHCANPAKDDFSTHSIRCSDTQSSALVVHVQLPFHRARLMSTAQTNDPRSPLALRLVAVRVPAIGRGTDGGSDGRDKPGHDGASAVNILRQSRRLSVLASKGPFRNRLKATAKIEGCRRREQCAQRQRQIRHATISGFRADRVYSRICQTLTASRQSRGNSRWISLQHVDRAVVDLERHGKGMPVLAAMGDREPRRVAEAVGCAMHDLGDLGQRADRPCTDPRHQQKLGKILRTTFRGSRQIAVQSPGDDVLWPDIVMGGHDEMRQQGLGFARSGVR